MPISQIHFARTFLFCLISNFLTAQFFWVTDSLRSPHPDWRGDTAHMTFTPSGLRSNAPDAGTLLWQRPSRASINAIWTLNATMEFNPSSSNFCEFTFIHSTQGSYLLQLSGNTNDDLSLIRRDPSGDLTLATAPGYLNQSAPSLRIRITRDSTYTFHVFNDTTLIFSAQDSTIRNSNALQIFCKFTKSRVDKFLFSTLHASGYSFKDTIAPRITQIRQLDPTTARIFWNEPTIPAPGFLNGAYTPTDTALYPTLTHSYWDVEFPNPLSPGLKSINIEAAVDTAGNLSYPPAQFLNWTYSPTKSAQLLVYQPHDELAPPFLTLRTPSYLDTCTLEILHPDGDWDQYLLILTDSLNTLTPSPTFQGPIGSTTLLVPNLKIPKDAVISLIKDGIYLLQRHAPNLLPPAQSRGHHALTSSNTDPSGWSISENGTYDIRQTPDYQPLANYISQIRAHSNGTLWAQFAHPVYHNISVPGSLGSPDPYTHLWHPHRPFWLPLLPNTPIPWAGDTLLPHLPITELSSSGIPPTELPLSGFQGHSPSQNLVINEIHFQPSTGSERIELWNPTAEHVSVVYGQLARMEVDGTLMYLEPFLPLGDCFAPEHWLAELHPVVLAESFLTVESPFALPDDSTCVELLDERGNLVDVFCYPESGSEERGLSWERISSAETAGGWHVPDWGVGSEHSLGKVNSLFGSVGNGERWADLEPNYVGKEGESATLHLKGEGKLTARIFTQHGMHICNISNGKQVRGETSIALLSHLNSAPNGIYFLQVELDGSSSQSAIFPFSILR